MSALVKIYQLAQNQGFSLVKVTPATTLTTDKEAYLDWLEHNNHGQMAYLARAPERRYTPEKVLPGAKSIILLALNYFQPNKAPSVKVARYALAKPDYHKVFERKLKRLQQALENEFSGSNNKFYVDYGPLMERPYAAQSSMGFIGKNTLLITKPYGSWVLLGEIITTLELTPEPAEKHGSCGSCSRCMTACPTGAIKNAYEIDSNLCISYLTIEYKGSIPLPLRAKMGTWLFGCDICQEVCPHNTRAQAYIPSQWHEVEIEPDLANEEYLSSLQFLKTILQIKDEAEFRKLFRNTPFLRAKRAGLIRNACIVAGNLGNKDLIPLLKKLSTDESELIREHASWALQALETNDTNPEP